MMTDPAASHPGTHLDPDQMADLFEGLLDTAAAEGARAHLASCPLCSSDFALITGEVDLGELLPPIPIPQDVVARVEAALHREPPLHTAATPSPGSHAVTSPPRRRRLRIALGSLAGATLVVAAGIGLFTVVNNNGNSSKSSNSVASGGAARPSDTAGDVAPDKSLVGTRGFGDMSIAQQAEALLSHHGMTPANGTAQPAKPDCPPSTVPPGTKLTASAQIQYQGKQAWLLLYPQVGSATAFDVYVVDVDACIPGNPGQYVYHIVVTRP